MHMSKNEPMNPEEHPAVQAIDAAIEAVTQLRESGVKTVPMDAAIWKAFCSPIKHTTVTKPMGRMPVVAAPSQMARASEKHSTPEAIDAAMRLLEGEMNQCQLCALSQTMRCPSQGMRFAPKVMVINGAYMAGDRPEAQGSRLEGAAGEMLWKMLGAIQLSPNDTYVTHAIRCPVTGRPPREAMLRCSEWLHREIRTIRPKAILLLGPFAGTTLFPNASAIATSVGKWMLFEGIPCLSIHHPMRLQMLDEAIARPLKMENWNALKELQLRLK
jgi:uracil-DNA glycosylase family 4